ncbi:MAG: glucose 1-dehydrogenase [Planctomycetota bacterium]|nr:glucose 1-dehydrogenase [Planctomycetota bacterium]
MSDELFSVKDQVVLVSGGSRGIGRAIVAEFVKRGAKVVATGRDENALKTTEAEASFAGNSPRVVVCDVLDQSQIIRTVDEVLTDYGRIDTLVNCAGVNRRMPTLDLTEEDYDYIFDINLKGAFHFSRAVGQQMIRQGAGCQINIASLNTDRPLPNVVPYAASKAALGNMTQALATEWGEFGVRVNAIAPGFILTDLTRKLWSDKTMHQWGIANTPQKRLGVPEDMAGTAIFLASQASAFMTGQVLYVDGGFTAGFSWPIPS